MAGKPYRSKMFPEWERMRVVRRIRFVEPSGELKVCVDIYGIMIFEHYKAPMRLQDAARSARHDNLPKQCTFRDAAKLCEMATRRDGPIVNGDLDGVVTDLEPGGGCIVLRLNDEQ
jgi:hypothetical protein